jgi:cell division protease FtsH
MTLAGALMFLMRTAGTPEQEPLVYSELLQAAQSGKVVRAEVDPNLGRATVLLRGAKSERDVTIPPGAGDLAERLTSGGARVDVVRKPSLPAPITALLIICLAAGVLLLIRHEQSRRSRVGGRDMDLRRSAAVTDDERPEVRFADVAGCEEVVEEVGEFVSFLQDPERFTRVGARMPSGVILHGPPGTGKTLLAKALAGEAGVPFFAVSGSDFVEQYVGVGAKRVRELFARARKATDGAVIFIDEIDAIGKRRSSHASGGNEEREGTLNELLVQMDGFQTDRRVVVVAATNRVDTLDPALLRPGRFARQVQVGLPGEEGRRAILAVHANGKPIQDGADLGRLAEITAGCSGADLADMLNEAAIMAARDGRELIGQEDLEEGLLRALAGPEKKTGGLRDEEKLTVAAHEAGHVLCAELCATQDKARRATIKPRGRAAGLALYGRTDRALHDAAFIHEQLICLLGGRAAEWVTEGKVSSGAANDLQQASAIARQAVEELGLSVAAGQMTASSGDLSDATRAGIDAEVERLVTEAYREAIALLGEHKDDLERLASALHTAEDMDRAEILAAIGRDLAPRPTTPGFGQLSAR